MSGFGIVFDIVYGMIGRSQSVSVRTSYNLGSSKVKPMLGVVLVWEAGQ